MLGIELPQAMRPEPDRGTLRQHHVECDHRSGQHWPGDGCLKFHRNRGRAANRALHVPGQTRGVSRYWSRLWSGAIAHRAADSGVLEQAGTNHWRTAADRRAGAGNWSSHQWCTTLDLRRPDRISSCRNGQADSDCLAGELHGALSGCVAEHLLGRVQTDGCCRCHVRAVAVAAGFWLCRVVGCSCHGGCSGLAARS
jgi:hypothetical protein